MTFDNRISLLRAAALGADVRYDEFYYRFYKSHAEGEGETTALRAAKAYYAALSELKPSISEGELIVGKPAVLLTEGELSEWKTKYKDYAKDTVAPYHVGQDSHMAVDYELLLTRGITGVKERIREYMAATDDAEKLDFYNSCLICLDAVIKCSENYAAEAERLAEVAESEEHRAELAEIARICRRVPAHPAESFHEALQSVSFLSFCLSMSTCRICHQQFQLGHPDRYLLKFYEKDLADRTLTREHAQLLLDCLGVQINMRVPNVLSSGYMGGGRDRDGRPVENELTEMCMQVVDDIRLVYPAVGLCAFRGMDDKYLKKACEILSHGCSHPAIFNDDIISEGLRCYGVPEDESHDYIHSTCVEITPSAASNVWVASPYTNMPQLLLDELDGDHESLDSLVAAILVRLDEKIKRNFERELENRRKRAEGAVNPLLSCFVNDCLSRGLDIERGGARYNWIMPSFVGVANLVDSLYAVKKTVFDGREMTLRELKAILDTNFEGNEHLRARLLNSLPKYGNDNDEIDAYFSLFTEHLTAECRKYTGMHSNARLIPSVFCWIMHEYFGSRTGATPDGRPAGFPLGDGSGPCQGRERQGATASVLSSTKWSHKELIGGVAVNMKFSKKSFTSASFGNMLALIKTYLARGGFEIQINVVDKATLERARECPELYSDIVVRVGGYSDYFVRLSPNMQAEILLRSEHEI